MDETYMGTIMLFAGNFAPRNWMYCDGQILPISDYQALFALIGATYGGDGRTTFALPDLRGRVPVHAGVGPGLTPKRLGEKSGTEYVTLNETQMPNHTHAVTTKLQAKEEANVDDPTNNFIAGTGNQIFGSSADILLNSNAVEVTLQNTGGSQPHYNMQPYLGLNYIICVSGLFPSRS